MHGNYMVIVHNYKYAILFIYAVFLDKYGCIQYCFQFLCIKYSIRNYRITAYLAIFSHFMSAHVLVSMLIYKMVNLSRIIN